MRRFKQFLTESESTPVYGYNSDWGILTRILQEVGLTYDSSNHKLPPAFVWCEYPAAVEPPINLPFSVKLVEVYAVARSSWTATNASYNRSRSYASNNYNEGGGMLTWNRHGAWDQVEGLQRRIKFIKLAENIFDHRLVAVDDLYISVWLYPGESENTLPPYKLKHPPAGSYVDPFEHEGSGG